MYTKNSKLYFEPIDFEKAVEDLETKIQLHTNVHLVTLYRGGLPLGVRMSNQLNLPLSILDYQRLDGDSKEVAMMKDAGIKTTDVIYLVDDIADEGITITEAIKFLQSEYPETEIVTYTIFGNSDKHPREWQYTFKHGAEWICFGPWEGYN